VGGTPQFRVEIMKLNEFIEKYLQIELIYHTTLKYLNIST